MAGIRKRTYRQSEKIHDAPNLMYLADIWHFIDTFLCVSLWPILGLPTCNSAGFLCRWKMGWRTLWNRAFMSISARPSHFAQKSSIFDCLLLHREEVSVLHCGCSF
jgi:hypothetical protein